MAEPAPRRRIVAEMSEPASDLAPASVPAHAIALSSQPPLRELWRYGRRHRRRVIAAATFSLLNKAFDVAPELLIGAAVDVVAQGEDSFVAGLFGVSDRFDQLTILTIVTVLIWLFESATEYVAVIIWRNLAQTIEHEARLDTYRHVQDLEMAYFEDRTSGGLMAVLNDDVNQLERFLDLGPHKLIITAANVVFVGVVFFVVSPLLALLAFLPIPIIVAGSLIYQSRLEPRYAKVRAAAGTIGDTLTNGIGGMATIKAFSGEDREAELVEPRARASATRTAKPSATAPRSTH
jgi:ATP-binding cassette, subfamily B, bacterial